MLLACQKKENINILSYGYFLSDKGIEFKIYAPSSEKVFLVIFDNHSSENGKEYKMEKKEEGDWYFYLKDKGIGTIYGYRLIGPNNDKNIIVADPYSKAAITQNNWRHTAKSLVINNDFDWQGDRWMNTKMNDLIIYEAHTRDMTIHSSSATTQKGTYIGFIENNQNGGIEHLKKLGVNALQLLPIWDFANFEIPYNQQADDFYNDWNPYERNHWGYMPTFFMAPESYYSSSWTDVPEAWNGFDGKAIKEMKSMVRELHRNGISVILDVVVNHVSNYDWHPLKYIDRETYFLLNEDGSYQSQCCGNLLDTDHPKVREYILESLKYWMIDYHVDGFRFDQCNLLSKETSKLIVSELKQINPNVIIYGEAWDNRESEFSKIGWGSFNARFRDVLRGELHDTDTKGFLFGSYRPNEDINDLKCILTGSTSWKYPIYNISSHSINFLEVHDNYSFNDYIRFSLNLNKKDDLIINHIDHIELNEVQSKINKLGALILLTSKGVPLIHQGQEWGHSQIIAETDYPDPNIGKMDRNPYNKDNETNWVNWHELDVNNELLEYYKDLITIRRSFSELRDTNNQKIDFISYSNRTLGYFIDDKIAILINGNIKSDFQFELPDGNWKLILDENDFDLNGLKNIQNLIMVEERSGTILIKS